MLCQYIWFQWMEIKCRIIIIRGFLLSEADGRNKELVLSYPKTGKKIQLACWASVSRWAKGL